jgi:Na+:H+ antiporter, NhaA family
MSGGNSKGGVINFLFENSMFLIFGALAGLIWANFDNASYQSLVHLEIPGLANNFIYDHAYNAAHPDKHIVTLHFLINDLLMALFFAIAGKEVFEATLPGGPLSDPKKAATPLIATLGGMVGPALFYVAGAHFIGKLDIYGNGWAIPCATDIAFSYMVARFVFGGGHPAIPFLLLLAIADDALGLIILAVFYPQAPINLVMFLLPILGMVICYFMKKKQVKSFWPYLLGPGIMSWVGFCLAGIHPALGLLPIIPMLPHAHEDKGLFDWRELKLTDTLNNFEHWWKRPVEIVLGLFGLLNAGVVMSSMGEATWLVLFGLLVGKPVGIWAFGMFAAKGLKFGFTEGINSKVLVIVGFVASIGFTVALFVSTVAFKPGLVQDAAKMGALISFVGAVLTIICGKLMKIERIEGDAGGHH